MKSLKDRIEELSLPQETKDKIFDAVLQAGRAFAQLPHTRLRGFSRIHHRLHPAV